MSRLLAVNLLVVVLLTASGCQGIREPSLSLPARELVCKGLHHKPRTRIGSYACSTLGTAFIEPDRLGSHKYGFDLWEKNGIVYTCSGGHIDIYHLRESADWTAFLASRTYRQLLKNRTEFSFRQKEVAAGHVKLDYPQGWQDMPKQQKEQAAHDISIRLGQYLAYTVMTWHEIITWYGYKSTAILPEFPSSFSWEDVYSNLLGCNIAGAALRDSENTYCEAMRVGINRKLAELGVQPAYVAERASNTVRGRWFSGGLPFIVDIRGKNFDIGLDDGFVTPWIVPSVNGCEQDQELSLPVPNTDFLTEYGFSMRFEIEPKEWEKDRVLSIIYANDHKRHKRIEPAVHYALILDHIQAAAAKMYGRDLVFSRDH